MPPPFCKSLAYKTFIGKKANALKREDKKGMGEAGESWRYLMEAAMKAHALGNLPEAELLYSKLLEEYPFLSRGAYNLGIVRNSLERYEAAEEAFLQALAYEPELFEAALNLAISVQEQGRFEEARRITAAIINRWPGMPDPYFIHGSLLLMAGLMPEGWEGYEYRFDTLSNPVPRRHPEIPLPDGTTPPGSRLLLSAEQGYGDVLQMIRYIPLLASAGFKLWLEVPAPLVSLLEQLEFLEGVLPKGAHLSGFDLHIPMMSLPRQFGTTVETVPAPLILKPHSAIISKMERLIPEKNKPRVGLAWSGRMEPPLNRKRSCPPQIFSKLLDIPGVTFVSLQKECPEGFSLSDPRLVDISSSLDDFHHTAALVSLLDLIITIDTSIAHLAGTMGKPAWLLLPFVPDWRWLLDRDDSPWYPSMRLFRQPSRNDWASVISRVQQQLAIMLPESVETLSNLGVLAESRGDSKEALSLYQAALSISPDSPVTLYNMGNSLKKLGETEQAEASYETALRLKPDFPEAHHNLAKIAQERKNLEMAHKHLARTLQHRPDFAEALHTLGELYQEEERFEEAAKAYISATEASPGSAGSWNSLGIVYQCMEMDHEAEPCYRKALELEADYLHARNNLGALLLLLGKVKESVATLEELTERAPDYFDGQWNLACSLIADGDWIRGWEKFEYRFRKHSPVILPHSHLPLWDGSPLDGKGILLQAEQAFGDTIQFVRFASAVAAKGGKVYLSCQHPAIVTLMSSAAGVASSLPPDAPLPDCICRAPLMSLPHILGVSPEEAANLLPYLKPSEEKISAWLENMPDKTGIKIGVCWSGRQTMRNRRRSCPPELLLPLMDIPGISLFSLQIGGASPPPGLLITDMTDRIDDFADSAALVSCLDIIVTIDTSVAHLAGALGKPVWLMLPETVDWRWKADCTDSLWYPTMRIFRRKSGSGWEGVIDEIRNELRRVALPKVYICKPDMDFKAPEHLGTRLVPLLADISSPVPDAPVILTEKREAADLIIFPYYMENLTEWHGIEGMLELTENLPAFCTREDSHVFFSDHDSPAPYQSYAWWFRTSLDPVRKDAGAIPIPYLTEDFASSIHFDAEKLSFHASFVGYLGHRKQRAPLLAGFADEPRLSILIEATEAFHGHQTDEKRAERRERYLKICSSSLCIISPAGDGKNSIRFFEALSMGRLPLLISDAPLPFEGSIPYHRFVLRIPPEKKDSAGKLLIEWLAGMGDDDPMERCREARKTWEKWFSPASLPLRLWNELLRRHATRKAVPGNLLLPDKKKRLPVSPAFYLEKGIAAAEAGLHDEAEKLFLAAIEYNHRYFDAFIRLGRLHAAKGRHYAAVERFYEASIIRPEAEEPYREAIPCLERLGRIDEVRFCISRITDPDSAEPDIAELMAEGDAFRESEEWEKAFGIYARIAGGKTESHTANLRAGGCLIFLNHHEEAKSFLLRATELNQDDADAHVNLAICYLSERNWEKGWEEFEWRKRYIKEKFPPFPELHRLFADERLDGKSIIVQTEQGYGDIIQFSRYLPLLAATGVKIILTAPEPMLRLLGQVQGVSAVIPHGETLPLADYQTLLLTLPLCLTAMNPSPPVDIPYITLDASLRKLWGGRVSRLSGMKIGLAWQGRNMNKSGYRRSISPEELAPVIGIQGCSFVSLHPEPLSGTIRGINDFSADIADFADTAALIANLDLVITIDTAVAHLAGAMNIPCWTMLLNSPDWRWHPLESDASLWYPGMRLFRQRKAGEWGEVVSQVVSSLEEELLTKLGHELSGSGRHDEALDCFRMATHRTGATPASWLNLGVSLHQNEETKEGIAALKRAIELSPGYPEAWHNLAVLQQALGEYDSAYTSFNTALRIRPAYETAKYNLSLLQLLIGDYRNGWKNFEARFAKEPPIPLRHADLPRWQGEDISGKRLLVHAEQGYGDTIQFLRFIPLLAGMGRKIILELQDHTLLSLARTLDCDCTVITRDGHAPEADLHIPLMSVPGVLKTTLETIPKDVPYLFADHERRTYWQRTIGSGQGLRIGLCWKGRNEHINDRFRSCPLSLLTPLFNLPKIQWFSLQFGPGKEQLALPDCSFSLMDLTASVTDFHDTAALMAELDLIITVDTAVAHLAGATGRPVWLLLPFAPDWRWGLASDSTPWYPSTRLFRQTAPEHNWDKVVEQLRCALCELPCTSPDAKNGKES